MVKFLRASLMSGLFLCSSILLGQDNGPSLEELEKMGSELDQQKAPIAPPAQNLAIPATDTGSPASAPSLLGDMSDAQSVDVRSKIKKVLEPNIFAGAPPLPGTLRNLAMGEAPEQYDIQEGDNLFDICDQLLDEGNYWPKLWAINPTIANPHFVYPGMKLHFYAGDENSPPYLRVVTEDDIVPVNKGDIVEKELLTENIDGILMRTSVDGVIPVIGPDELEKVPVIDDMFLDAGRGRGAQPTRVIIPAFIVEDEFPTFGTVIGGSAGSILLSSGDEVIIEEEDEGLREGGTFSVVREISKIYQPNGGRYVGRRYELIGHLQVKSKEESIYKARVGFTRLGIQPGDLVIPYRSVKRSVPVSISEVQKGAEQEVVAFTEPFMEIGGRGGMVFIDQSAAKLQEGASYELVQNVKTSAPHSLKDKLPDTDHKVAKIYVLDASGAAALAYILSDSFEVRLGDRVAR